MFYFLNSKRILALASLILIFHPLLCQQKLTLNELLKSVDPNHPRIIYSFNVQEKIESLQANDILLAQQIKLVLNEAENLLPTAVLEYQKGSQSTFGKSAGEAVKRISTFVIAFRHTGRKEFFDRSIAEMNKIASLPSWNPEYFSDVAQLTTALALGYDWFYTSLNGEIRKKYADALFNKGIKAGLMSYQKSSQGQNVNWINHQGSLNLLCNSSMIIGAIALARDYPGPAAQVITYAINSLPNTLKATTPEALKNNDISWEYASNNTIIAVSALKSSIGNNFGLSSYKGYENVYKSHLKFCESAEASSSISLISKWFLKNI